MIADLDIWRAAKLMVDRYGEDAATQAAVRADDFAAKEDGEGKAIWVRIMRAIEELRRGPSEEDPVN